MGAVDGHEFVVDRGEGCYVWDEQGRRYLDGTASLWYANVGYGRAEIARAAAEQLEKLHAYHVFGDFATAPCSISPTVSPRSRPSPSSKVFLTSGGSDSVDTAAKLARRYFHEIGQPERTVILTPHVGLPRHARVRHGARGYRRQPRRAGRADRRRRASSQWDSADALEEAIDRIGADRIAAFFCEPVVGAGGVRFAPDGYLPARARSFATPAPCSSPTR